MSEKNIYQRINAVMSEVDYIKRGSAGQGTGVLYDEVIAMLRPLLIKHGIVVTADFLADTSRENAKGNYIYEGFFSVSYINTDKSEDRAVTKVVAHAMDAGDKAPGKAITYATKISMLKVFAIETGINDEGRVVNTEGLTDEQVTTLTSEIGDDVPLHDRVLAAFGVKSLGSVPIKQYSKVLKMVKTTNKGAK